MTNLSATFFISQTFALTLTDNTFVILKTPCCDSYDIQGQSLSCGFKAVGQNKIHHNKPAMDKRVGRSKYPRGGRVSTLGTLADVTQGDTKS